MRMEFYAVRINYCRMRTGLFCSKRNYSRMRIKSFFDGGNYVVGQLPEQPQSLTMLSKKNENFP
jgi:hypothetical protein